MQLIEKLKKSTLIERASYFPRGHVLLASGLLALLFILLAIPDTSHTHTRNIQSLTLPPAPQTTELTTPDIQENAVIKPATRVTPAKSLRIKAGDNLSLLFSRAGLTDREMMNFLASAENAKQLDRIRPGHNLDFHFDLEHKIEQLTYIMSPLKRLEYSKGPDDRYSFKEIERRPDVKHASRQGTIEQSLYLAGTKSGLDDSLIMELAEIFGWDIDFALDMRKGDSFSLLYEELFLDGEKLGNGAILSAEFVNQGQSFQAVRFVHESGRAEYYAPDGRNMRKAFLRAPVDFRRISSNFNPRRLHPVTKTIRAHRGIDYAAKTGTPIWSSGDGKVIASSYTKYNGNYVVIQHGNNVQTKYLHLHKRHVKKGQRVRQKQVIGTVGSTGLANGAHLHYEFLLNGVHRNPRTIVNKLPKAESIASSIKDEFLRQTQPLIAELAQDTQPTQIALNNTSDSPNSL